MPTQLVERPRLRAVPPARRGTGGRGPGDAADGAGSRYEAAPGSNAVVGIAAVLAGVVMLFIAFTSAYMFSRDRAGWPALALPWVLWVNTAALLASSATLEWARRRIRRGDTAGLRRGLAATGALGLLFVLGQLAAWRQLAAQGIFIRSNPHSSFFYLLTGVHGLHLLGGVVALAIVLERTWRGRYTARAHEGVDVCATYWHFMDLLWLYLFALLFWV